MALPTDAIQHYVQPWWVDDPTPTVCRGRLLRALVPYPEQNPYILAPNGRTDDSTDHKRARFSIEPYRIDGAAKTRPLPVAALPLWKGERFVVARGKVRPVVVISTPGPRPPRSLAGGLAPYQVSPTILVAPYFGATQDGSRGGVPEALLARFRRAEYPQYVWDTLPLADVRESYLRLDQVFPIGSSPGSYELTAFRLSDDALKVLDEWLEWLLSGNDAPSDRGTLGYLRTELLQVE